MSADELAHEPPPARWPRWPLALAPLALLPVPPPVSLPVAAPAAAALPVAGELSFTTVWWAAGGVVHRSPASGGGPDAVVRFPVPVDAERSFVTGARVVGAGTDGVTYLDGLAVGRGVPLRSDDTGRFWVADGRSLVSVDAASGAYGRRLPVAGVPVAVVGERAVTGVLAAGPGWTVGLDRVAVDRRGRRRTVEGRVTAEGERLVFTSGGRLRAMDARARARLVFGSDGTDGRVVFAGRYAVFVVADRGGLAVRAHRMGEATFALGLRLPADAVLLGVG